MRRMGIEGLLWLLLAVAALGTWAVWLWCSPHHRMSQTRAPRPSVSTTKSEEEIPYISREQQLRNALANAKTPEERGGYYLAILHQSSEKRHLILILGVEAEEEKPPLPPSVMATIYIEWARESLRLNREPTPDQLEELATIYAKCLNAALSEITMEEDRVPVPGVGMYSTFGDREMIRQVELQQQKEMEARRKAVAQNDLVDACNHSLEDLRRIFRPRPESRVILEQKLDLYLKQPQYRQAILDRVYGEAAP